jgi:hypothetical protein
VPAVTEALGYAPSELKEPSLGHNVEEFVFSITDFFEDLFD